MPSAHAGETLGGGGLRPADGTVARKTGHGNANQEFWIPDSVLRVTRHKRAIEGEDHHPSVFPVALPEFVLNAFSDVGAICFEPFSGSGTTIIAGQRTGRRVRAIELPPAYVEAAVQRFRHLFPDVPITLDGDGRNYDEIGAERRQEREAAQC